MTKNTSQRDLDSQEGQNTSRRFSEGHLAGLKSGARRRSEEQIVGNWIRMTNPVLYAQLLAEATLPSVSKVLEAAGALTSRPMAVPEHKTVVESLEPSTVETGFKRPPPTMVVR